MSTETRRICIIFIFVEANIKFEVQLYTGDIHSLWYFFRIFIYKNFSMWDTKKLESIVLHYFSNLFSHIFAHLQCESEKVVSKFSFRKSSGIVDVVSNHQASKRKLMFFLLYCLFYSTLLQHHYKDSWAYFTNKKLTWK